MWTTRDNSAAREAAETIAIKTLGFLAQDEERLERFLALSGLRPNTLRKAAAEPGFLAAVLDHVLAQDSLVQEVAADQGVDPTALARARAALDTGPAPLTST